MFAVLVIIALLLMIVAFFLLSGASSTNVALVALGLLLLARMEQARNYHNALLKRMDARQDPTPKA